MRCLSVLDLVILFYLFIFFLGHEAQNVDFTRKMTLSPKKSLQKITFSIKITIFQQMKYFNEN